MEKATKTINWFGMIILYLLLNVFGARTIKILNIQNNLILNLATLGIELLITLIFILFYIKDFQKDLPEIRKNDKEYLGNSLRIWLLGLIIMILSNSVISYIVGGIAENEELNRQILNTSYIYAIPSMVIMAPIVEEILFRLSLGKIFNNKYIFAIISGLVFGYMHVIGSHGLEYLYIIPYGALGASFGYLYKKYNNIYCSIFAHMIHNLLCVIIITLI